MSAQKTIMAAMNAWAQEIVHGLMCAGVPLKDIDLRSACGEKFGGRCVFVRGQLRYEGHFNVNSAGNAISKEIIHPLRDQGSVPRFPVVIPPLGTRKKEIAAQKRAQKRLKKPPEDA